MFSSKVTQSNTGTGQPVTPSVSSAAASDAPASANVTAGLEKGQIVRGEVVDLRSNEVSVKLDDGRLLSGKLENPVNLSIGQKVSFRVEDVSLKSITLKIVAEGQYNLPDTTIDKALEAAGLSKNLRNRSIVQELLSRHMSIDRNTILNIIQQSVAYKNSSVNTLILMNQYHIPVTDANVSQFEEYIRKEHGMMNQLEELAESVSKLLTQADGSTGVIPGQIINQADELLKLVLGEYEGNTKNDSNAAAVTGMVSAAGQTEMSNEAATVGNLLTPKECLALSELLESYTSQDSAITKNFIDSVKEGTAGIRDTAQFLNQIASATGHSIQDSAEKSALQEGAAAAETLLKAYQDPSYGSNELGTFLTMPERTELLKSLEPFSLPPEVSRQTASGDITADALLKLIRQKLNEVPDTAVRELFTSKEYQTLLKETLTSKWAFTPDSLTKKDEIERHFESLSHELNKLMNTLEQAGGSGGGTPAQQAGRLQDNISFMKTLNELFTYVQLPLKLHGQKANGELYVYTRKKSGRTAGDGISVLLHLDLEHLGPVDIHIDLHHNNVIGKFYLNDEAAGQLIASNIQLLEEALQRKGYSLNAEILEREKDIDIVKDFIAQDTAATPVTRYNFDIRA